MGFFVSSTPPPLVLPAGERVEKAVYTGTACLAFMDSAVTGDVWEDILYDGVTHEHGAGGLMLNSAAVGTHLEHDGDFPVELVLNDAGEVLGFRVNIDPYAEDLMHVRDLDGHGDSHDEGHSHEHSHDGQAHTHPHDHAHGHDHGHDHSHGHEDGHGHPEGWSAPERIRLVSATGVFGDPASLPEADNLPEDLLSLTFPAAGGNLAFTVCTERGMRREIVAVWSA